MRTAEICKDINRIIIKSLYSVAPHLVESEVDIEPRHEAFWMVGGKSMKSTALFILSIFLIFSMKIVQELNRQKTKRFGLNAKYH